MERWDGEVGWEVGWEGKIGWERWGGKDGVGKVGWGGGEGWSGEKWGVGKERNQEGRERESSMVHKSAMYMYYRSNTHTEAGSLHTLT